MCDTVGINLQLCWCRPCLLRCLSSATVAHPLCTPSVQVVAYNPGEFYTEHYDNKAGGIVTRCATIICYLGDCKGGATYFPKSAGLHLIPR